MLFHPLGVSTNLPLLHPFHSCRTTLSQEKGLVIIEQFLGCAESTVLIWTSEIVPRHFKLVLRRMRKPMQYAYVRQACNL